MSDEKNLSLLSITFLGILLLIFISSSFNVEFLNSIIYLKLSTYELISSYDINSKINLKKSSEVLEFIVQNVDSIVNSNIAFKNEFISGFGLYQKLIWKKTFDNFNTIKDDNGHLQQPTLELLDTDTLNMFSENLELLSLKTKEWGIPFLYIQSDYQNVKTKTKLPYGLFDKKNEIIDSFLSIITKKDIPILDLRSSELIGNLSYDEMFYKTDHHWAIDYSFYAVTEILNEINDRYSIDTTNSNKVTNIDNYESLILKDSFLGSLGIKIGPYYAGKDDFKVLIPKFETDFNFYMYIDGELEVERKGDFSNTLIDIEKLQSEYVNKYNTFLFGGYDENIVINNKALNNLKVLLISTSYGRQLTPYLSLSFKEVYYIDPQIGRFDRNVLDYIEEINPDMVLVLYGAVPYIPISLE